MALMETINRHAASVFLTRNHFGEPVTRYIRGGETTETVTAIVERSQTTEQQSHGERHQVNGRITVADDQDLNRNDRWGIHGHVYETDTISDPDGSGLRVITINRATTLTHKR